ncbi:unnamed protein product [Arabis nemorensis]|uniref:Serine-threonine/tyrosine-protein kinase catalytic domain-containing protein n=1 Tax=Arabis nemorensis TaxID=586526 RepID=A0A565BQH4_9BRAS|nr:unnamed protein product [Arabis nemorensis]
MSPEQAVTGKYSRKSDIFSFGIIVLEIVSGKQNRESSSSTNLPSHVWAKWKEGNWEETLDPVIRHSSPFPSEQVRRCIEIGLLCVQQVEEDGPNMTLVETMLASQSYEIRHPQQPGFFMGQGQFQDQIPSSSSTYGECSMYRANLFTNSALTMPR